MAVEIAGRIAMDHYHVIIDWDHVIPIDKYVLITQYLFSVFIRRFAEILKTAHLKIGHSKNCSS